MLLRPDGDATLVIGQPAHAWVSGQLARAWGNERFGTVEPREEVCLGAEQHDVGMAKWDLRPTLNPGTGLPRSFMELDLDTHLGLWSTAADRVMAQSGYAALLVSLHGTGLYERRRGDDERIRAFLAGQRALQADLLRALGADAAQVARNMQLVGTWDALSLALLLDWAPYTLEEVPAASGSVDVELRDGTLDPWPFTAARVALRCEGRRLTERFDDEEAMRAALAAAPRVALDLELRDG